MQKKIPADLSTIIVLEDPSNEVFIKSRAF
jgi:hypothetical protein